MTIIFYSRLVISRSGDGAVIGIGINGYLFEIIVIDRNIMSVSAYRTGQPELCRNAVADAAPCPKSGAGAEFVYLRISAKIFKVDIIITGPCKEARDAAVVPAADRQRLVVVIIRYVGKSPIAVVFTAAVCSSREFTERRAAVKAMFCGIIERGTDGDGLQRRTTLKGAQHIPGVVGIAGHVGADKIDIVADLDALEVGVARKGAAADDRDVLAPEEIIGIRNGDGIGHDDIRVLSVALCELVGVVAYFFKLKVRHSELVVADLYEVLISVGIDELSFACFIVLLDAVDIRFLRGLVIGRSYRIYAVGSEGLPRISVPFDAVGVEVDIVTVGRQVDFSVALRRSVRFRVKVKMTVAVIPLFEPYLVIVAQRDIARAVIDVGRIIYVKVGFIEIRIHAAYDEI